MEKRGKVKKSTWAHSKSIRQTKVLHSMKEGKQTYRQTRQTKDSEISCCSLLTKFSSSLSAFVSILPKIGNKRGKGSELPLKYFFFFNVWFFLSDQKQIIIDSTDTSLLQVAQQFSLFKNIPRLNYVDIKNKKKLARLCIRGGNYYPTRGSSRHRGRFECR